MIPVRSFEGKDVAVFGLGRSGIATCKALMAGGARVCAWDDNESARKAAEDAGVPLVDLNRRDWQTFAALVLSPGIPFRFPEPHRFVRMAQMVGVPVIGDMELFARALNEFKSVDRPRIVGITGTNGKSTTTALIHHILEAAGKPTQMAILTLEGGVTWTQWAATLPFVVIATATTIFGIRNRERIDAKTYRRWLLRLLFVIALVLVIQYALGAG